MPIDGYLPLKTGFRDHYFFISIISLLFYPTTLLSTSKFLMTLFLFLICLNLYRTMNLLNKDNKFISFIYDPIFDHHSKTVPFQNILVLCIANYFHGYLFDILDINLIIIICILFHF